MEQSNLEELAAVTLTPYIQRATALIGVPRKIGGNQFRHMMATLDLLEDIPETDQQIILNADVEGSEVLTIVRELTRRPDESKTDYLIRIRDEASFKSKIIKLADRISNLTDINTDIFDYEFISRYIDETEKYLLPMAKEINENMYNELYDLIVRKKKLITNLWQMQNILKNLFTKNNKKNH